MTYYQYLRENLNVIRVLLLQGTISSSIPRDMEIYSYYEDVRALGNTKSASFMQAKNHFKVGRTKMYKVLAIMGEPV